MGPKTQEPPAAKTPPATQQAAPPQAAAPAEQPQAAAPAFKLAPPRKAPKTGMITSGIVVICGLPKNGKTSLVTSIPDNIVIELEAGGADRVDGWVQDVKNIGEFRQAYRAAIAEPRAKAVTIDTGDALIDWMSEDICVRLGVGSMSDKVEGANQWQMLRERFENLFKSGRDSGKLFVLNMHFKEPKLDTTGKLVVGHNVDAPGKLAAYICGKADLLGICTKAKVGAEMKYYVSFVGGEEVGAYGSRVRELEGKKIELPYGRQWQAITEACLKAQDAKAAESEKKDDKAGKKQAKGEI